MDNNSKYFHIRANQRRVRNKIESLQAPDESWYQDRTSIEQLLVYHFKNISSTSNPVDSYHFLEHIPACINQHDNNALISVPYEQEIYKSLISMDPWRSPGPDGFPPGFYQTQWKVVKDNICKMVHDFFHSGHLLKKINNTRVTLIPKVNSPQKS
ncbi:uncharacterized protein LOC113311638 [Papaver somniferum]|uniref:uncharacterized protein LOC113311638 n=1 Tax=Papaver somniferum TaxID=3469 RepID=UPI000E6FD5FD|nr:uncharacterized protein LOC113311638 [Papaver somniferum]